VKNLKMFCTTLEPNHFNFIKKIGYTPVGLGEKSFIGNWFRDNTGVNISKKNKNYAECTYHYWFWKNYLDKHQGEWIGFCHYRKFWSLKQLNSKDINFNKLDELVLKQIPEKYEQYESIIGEPFFVNQFRGMKFIKKGMKIFLKKPSLFFNKKKRTLKFHFDFMHGENNLSKAIDLLDKENQNDFRKFVNTEISFNPFHMFICKSKEKMKKYYDDLFPWLENCEKIFGFDNLDGYGKQRIYAFLAERFMPYWFQKNTKYTTLPIFFYDIRNDLDKS
jgi:hypothetical protein|tara:strand:+ start:279 stop:1106 length:828 start_codon:yes stop_codon:yes gene_type:complete